MWSGHYCPSASCKASLPLSRVELSLDFLDAVLLFWSELLNLLTHQYEWNSTDLEAVPVSATERGRAR